jgi:hypothetical protein
MHDWSRLLFDRDFAGRDIGAASLVSGGTYHQ